MAWQFELVAGPYEGPTGGVVRDGDAVIFSTIDEGRLLGFDPKTNTVTEARRYTNRVNGLARGPGGELYGAQEGGRRLIEFTPDNRVVPVDALLDGKYHNQPSDLVVDRQHRIYFTDPRHAVIPFGPAIFPFLDHCSVLRLERNDRRAWVASRVPRRRASCALIRSAPTAPSTTRPCCTPSGRIIAARSAASRGCASTRTATSSRSRAGGATAPARWSTSSQPRAPSSRAMNFRPTCRTNVVSPGRAWTRCMSPPAADISIARRRIGAAWLRP